MNGIVFAEWMTNKVCFALFPAGTTVRDSHHLKSLVCCEQDLNLWILSKRRCKECTYRKTGQKWQNWNFRTYYHAYNLRIHKITSPTLQVQKIYSKQLIDPFMANLLSKQLKCPKTEHIWKTVTTCWELILSESSCLWMIKGPYLCKKSREMDIKVFCNFDDDVIQTKLQ